ncbi:hypothetical protein C8Q75DRAFT_890904 [Abortiporus biennis]|nr:hypothetical protein C8Q75DRAFT_890904 [Abortiporus biennis]
MKKAESSLPRVAKRYNTVDESILSRHWGEKQDCAPKSPKSFKSPVAPKFPGGNAASDADAKGNEGGSSGWTELDKKFKTYDEKMIHNWNDEIDTLLVFAGLFSAVVTAFNIVSFQRLSVDSSDVSLLVLQRISEQLASFTLSNSFLNSTAAPLPFPPTSFHAPKSVIRINMLWFTSLVFSLVSASLAMLVKQWLREYVSGDHSSPRMHARIRQFRYHGLAKWRVFEIMALLPILLQVALILFLIGLISFLELVDGDVSKLVTIFISIWLAVYVVATILPTFAPDCPYKSPQARVFYNLIRVLKGEKPWQVQSSSPHLSWGRFEASILLNGESLEVDALITADATFTDDELLGSIVGPCLKDVDGPLTMYCLRRVLINRLLLKKRQVETFFDSLSKNLHRMTHKGFHAVSDIILDTLEKATGRPAIDSEGPNFPSLWETLSFLKVIVEGRGKPAEPGDLNSGEKIEARTAQALTKLVAAEIDSEPVVQVSLGILSNLLLGPVNSYEFLNDLPSLPAQIPTILRHSEYILSTGMARRNNAETVNPMSFLCVILSLVNQVPKDVDVPDSFRTGLQSVVTIAAGHISTTYSRVFPSLTELCINSTKKMQERFPDIGDDLLRKLEPRKRTITSPGRVVNVNNEGKQAPQTAAS